jgi:hypothetical protein
VHLGKIKKWEQIKRLKTITENETHGKVWINSRNNFRTMMGES